MDNKIIGVWGLSYWSWVGVLELNNESMLIQYCNDEPMEVDIQYEYDEEHEDYDRNYIIFHGMKLYLEECMRI